MKAFKILAFSIFFGASLNAQVGFGTTSPSNDIDVESSSATETAVDINNTGGGDPKINLQLNGTTTFSIGVDNDDADKLKIGTTAPETNTRVTIDNTGNVGIGTTSPTRQLDVEGQVTIHPTGTTADNLYNGQLIITKPVESGQYINLIRAGHRVWSIGYRYNTNDFAIGNGVANDAAFSPTFTIRASDGNVGIGSTAPSEKLDIESNDATKTALDINNTGGGDPKINLQVGGVTTFSMGIDNSDADKFKIGTSALETNTRFTIDASGNVGIGTSSPSVGFDVANVKVNIWSGSRFYGNSSSMPLGSLTIGNTSASFGGKSSDATNMCGFLMECKDSTEIAFHDMSSKVSSFVLYDGTNNRLTFGRDMGFGEISTLSLNGNVGIGTSAPSQKLHVVGNICATGTIATCSDLRYKKDIFKIDNALSLITKFNGYTYNYKVNEFPENKFDSTAQVGFIAQELQEVLPQVVQKNEQGYLSVDYAKVTPLLLMAIKEQQAIIESLKKANEEQNAKAMLQKAEIDALKQNALKVAELENKINAMLLLLNNKQELTVKQ